MNYEDSAAVSRAITELIKKEPDAVVCWREILSLTGQSHSLRLSNLDVSVDVGFVAYQVERMWLANPIPPEITFLYFGLYDLADSTMLRGRAGFYLSGGNASNPTESLELGEPLIYQPGDGYLKSELLDEIKTAEHEQPEDTDVLDYAVMLGGAAILARGAMRITKVALPAYVGFDSGDIILIPASE